MARKTKLTNKHEFTQQIHSTKRSGTQFSGMTNWDERKAKSENRLSCKNCRFFGFGCSEYIGKWHSPCEEFQWD